MGGANLRQNHCYCSGPLSLLRPGSYEVDVHVGRLEGGLSFRFSQDVMCMHTYAKASPQSNCTNGMANG